MCRSGEIWNNLSRHGLTGDRDHALPKFSYGLIVSYVFSVQNFTVGL
jgi:hypothetical protein